MVEFETQILKLDKLLDFFAVLIYLSKLRSLGCGGLHKRIEVKVIIRFRRVVRQHLKHKLRVLPHKINDMNPLTLVYLISDGNFRLSRLCSWISQLFIVKVS